MLKFFAKYKQLITEIAILILVIYFANYLNQNNRKDIWEFQQADIYFEVKSAQQINNGENPYTTILKGNLLNNNPDQKYSTLFPLYYYYLAYLDKTTGSDFEGIMDLHREIVYVAQIVAAVFIYLIFRRENKPWIGLLAATFFVFNRWTLANIADAKHDVIAIAALMISMYLFVSKNKSHLYLAAFFYGISMGLKHIGLFISPIFLLPVLYKRLNFKETLLYAFAFLLPSIGVGLPLILNSINGFFYSIMFSFTRAPFYEDGEYVYESLVLYDVGVKNNNVFFYILPRIPLVFFSLFSTVLVLLKKVPIFVYCFAALFIFVAFNPILFDQYFTWITPFIFLAVLENKVFISQRKEGENNVL